MWQFSKKKVDLACAKAMQPDLEQGNLCSTVWKSILAHYDEHIGWQLRTYWMQESFTIYNWHFPFQERAFLISEAVDL